LGCRTGSGLDVEMVDLVQPVDPVVQISPTAVRWTRQDCCAIERAGILTYRYELVEGIINRMSQSLGHANMIRLLIGWLVAAFGIDFFFTQTTIDVRLEDNPASAPELDGIVLNHPAGDLTGIPAPADIRLLIEATDTTLAYDLGTKARLYARAGIIEYWVVSLVERKLYIHRWPTEGVYQEITSYQESEQATPLGAPGAAVAVSRLLPRMEHEPVN
jgi:Uma2 family endonuclease